jgi:hypothetical protein
VDVVDCQRLCFVFQVVRAASPVLLRFITLGAFFIYFTVSTLTINDSASGIQVHVKSDLESGVSVALCGTTRAFYKKLPFM